MLRAIFICVLTHLSFRFFGLMFFSLMLFGLMFFSVATKPAHAQMKSKDGLELQADSISRDYEARTIILEGNVRIGFGTEKLSCNKAEINMRKQEVVAVGNVSLESADTYIEGEKIIYNYKTKLGEIRKGFVQAGQVVFLGDIIKKNSETKYLATQARYTSCATCPPAWSFSGSEIEAEIGGYAYIKYPVLRLGDVPVLILPRMLVPLKSDRQSGILVPSLDYSTKGGTAFTLPYFWAISRSQDMTYALKNYEKRGLKQMVEYRYVLDPGSSGRMSGAFLRDEAFSDNGKATGDTETLRRGFINYSHYYELPEGFIHRTELNMVSDLRYPRDFSEELTGHGDPALENKMSLTRNTEGQHMSVEADYYKNLLNSDTRGDNSDAVHRFPEIVYNFTEREVLNSNFFFKFDFDYTNFARRDFSYDDVTGSGSSRVATPIRDGSFDIAAGDQIRTGHRYILQPAISYPFHIGSYLDVNPSVIYNETQYRFNASPDIAQSDYDRNAERRYIQTDVSFKTKYSAVFGSTEAKSTRYKHEIEPEVIYSRIPWVERPDNTFFGNFQDQPYYRHSEAVSNADFQGDSKLQFDYRDRLFDKDIATIVLSNYLIRKTFLGDDPSYQKFFTFRLSQSYDFNEARRSDPEPWSTVNSLLDVRLNNFETHTTADYYPYAKATNWSTRLKFISQMKNYLELTYSHNVIVEEENNVTGQETETMGLGLGSKNKYMDLVGRTNYSLVTDQLESWEYVATMKPPGDCWSIKFGHKKTLGSDTVFKFSFNFEFGG